MLGFWSGVEDSYIREKLYLTWEYDSELYIEAKDWPTSIEQGHWQAREDFYNSKFCICPGGPQLDGFIAFAIHYGCIPVILSDYYDLPFNDILDWRKFSVILKENDVYSLKKILQDIPKKTYEALQNHTFMVQKHFQWNLSPVKYDAFHMVMYDLWLRHHATSGLPAQNRHQAWARTIEDSAQDSDAFDMDCEGTEMNFKISVYPHNTNFCEEPRKLEAEFGNEGLFYENLNRSRFLTKDPDKAHLFLIPTYCHSLPAED
ncbi:hypothetical protein SADUNF_Sadunf07G0100900 [Salix dunnii]|uniref:Exostosin GT47 domain-containing protein n=1 Tax=Salix dunnii TaxID=1413687 RepID=A0A835K461_9ROSI|nr:hypothetical protein SADUNF_Sadunf07G0100900 [Salix dunnii]